MYCSHLDVLRHVPGEVDHGHDGLVPLALVPLVPLDSCHVLPGDGNYYYDDFTDNLMKTLC